jgi:uncharacterized membrane protein YfcA
MLGCVRIASASIVGGATGFGTALVATPLMLLAGISVPEVVFVILVVGLVTRCAVVFRLRAHVVWSRMGLLALGSVPGAWAGAEVLHVVSVHYLKIAAGVLAVLCGISMVVVPEPGEPRPPSAAAQVATGAVGGFLSTTTALNGPPPALLLTRAGIPPLVFIADMDGYFTVVSAASLVILGARGQIPHCVGTVHRIACTALSRDITSMSRLLQPRDRSFIGAESPCRIGPSAIAPPSRSASL